MCERRKEQEENCNGLHVRRITQSNNRNNTIFFSPATIIFHSVEIQRTVFNEIVFANMFTLTICNICDFHGPLSTLWHTHTSYTLPPHCSWLTFLYALRFFFASQLICARIFFSITDNEMLNTHTGQSKSICVIVRRGFSQLINIGKGSRGEPGKVHCSNVILMKKDWVLQHSKRTNYFRNKNLNSQMNA